MTAAWRDRRLGDGAWRVLVGRLFSMTDAQIAEIYALARESSPAASNAIQCKPIPST